MSEIRIQDDLYEYVNHDKLEELVIPDDKPTAGGFAELNKDVEKILINDFSEMSESGEYPNEYLRKAGVIYNKAKDVKGRKKDGIKPVLKALSAFEKADSLSKFNKKLAVFSVSGYTMPFEMGVDADMMDTMHHCVMIQGPSTILPDTVYYKEGMEAQKQAMLGLWSNMAKAILAKTKLSEEEQNQYIADTLAYDAVIATLVKSRQEWSEYTKMYNPMKTSKVASMLKPLKFKKMLEELFVTIPEKIIVTDPRFFKNFNTLFNEETFTQYKHWAYVNTLISSCGLLSEELRELGSQFERALMGIPAIPSVETFAYQLASGIFSEPVGLYYGEKYFGEAAKKDIISIVKEIIETYKSRVRNNDFLQDSTKEKAILKLSKMEIKMGYPDKVDELYDKFVFNEEASLFEIVTEIRKIRILDNCSKLFKDVDRTKWVMPGHMVNACYNPTSNDITFPAAILQAPFYSIKQTRSENLGGIGAVIGHEISHAFDNNGANCDENGNLVNWWTKEDHKMFVKKTKAMIKEFEGIELPWGKVNSTLIVSENIADNGGMAVTLEIMSKMDDANYEEYFKNWARVWCLKGKPEYLQLLLNVDVHAPTVLRANMQPRNFEEWYKTFNVKKTDKMYIAPSKRVVIW